MSDINKNLENLIKDFEQNLENPKDLLIDYQDMFIMRIKIILKKECKF